jgi:hypothetical protein
MSSGGNVTRLLAELKQGNQQARGDLIALVYGELRRLAARYMRTERPEHTLQATALVHEAYLLMRDINPRLVFSASLSSTPTKRSLYVKPRKQWRLARGEEGNGDVK